MSDAACDQNSIKNNIQDIVATSCNSLVVEEHWRKGIILVQIWREVLRVLLFAGDPDKGLDEKSKKEMWLLLVAAGSGYLARCWHKTLKPKPQLTDRPHDGDENSLDHQDRKADDQRVGNNNDNKNILLLTSSSSSSSPQSVSAEKKDVSPLNVERIRKTPELAPKPLKRSFSPKAFGKKLFSSDGSKNLKASKKDGALSSLSEGPRSSSSVAGEKESSRSILFGLDKSLFSQDASASVGHSGSSRRSPWSSFRSSSGKAPGREGSPGPADDDDDSSTESSPGCFKRAGDSFRKNRDWRKTDTGSFSSRSLQSTLGGDGRDGGPASAGSSRREMNPPDSLHSSSELTNRSFGTPEIAEPSSEVGELPEVTSKRQAAENDAKITSISSSTVVINRSESSTIRKEGPSSTSVAAVVARIEKGSASAKAETVNAILSIRAANQAQAQAQAKAKVKAKGQVIAVSDIVKARTLKLEVLEQESVEDDIVPGGKGKRRAGDGGSSTVTGTRGVGKGAGLSAPLSTGKRTKDSKDSGKSDSSGVTLTSISSRWRKDASFIPMEDSGEFGETSTSSGIGAVDLSQVFFGFDSTFLSSPAEEKSPLRFYRRSRQLNRSGRRNMRKMRESPRPVSALESCLRAQFPERDTEGSRVARSLNFSSYSVGQRGPQLGGEFLDQGSESPFPKDLSQSDSPRSSSDGRGGLGGGSEQQSPDHIEGALGLPPLGTPPSTRRSASSGSRGFSSERGHVQLGGSASKYPRNVVFEDRGRVVSSQSKLSDVLWRPTTLPVALKKRKVSQACSPSANSDYLQAKGYEMEALVVPPMEGLLFSFGVGIGVMSLVDGTEDKVEKLSRELQKSEEQIENLNNLLRQARESSVVYATLSKELVVADRREVVHATASLSKELVVADRISSEEAKVVQVSGINESPLDPLSVTPAIEERSLAVTPAIEERSMSVTPAIEESGRPFDLYRKEAPETPQLTDHMADLEAELEAELDALTSSITDGAGGPPDFEELDPEGVAGVADRDLGVEGLPAVVDWDDDNDDFITEEPAHSGGGVPPRELSRLLRKVLSSRQEHHISELQADLQETVEKLQAVEKELRLLREKAKSFAPLSAGSVPESSDSVARSVSESLVDSDKDSWSAQIERLNQSVFEDQESRREDVSKSGIGTDSSMGDTQKSSGEKSAASTSSRPGPGSNVLESVASEPAHSTGRPVENDPTPHLPARAASEPVTRPVDSAASEVGASKVNESVSGQQDLVANGVGSVPRDLATASKTASSSQRSVSSLILSEEDRNSEAQADNDAVCDEFLSSVFCSPDGSLLGLSSALSSPLMDQMLSNTREEDSRLAGIATDIPPDMAVTVGDDLDQVVGQLLKRDSSSVKNAINAFLRWEAAETDDTPIKDDIEKEVTSRDERIEYATRKDDTRKDTSKKETSKEETSKVDTVEEDTTIGGYSRRTAGKNPTPQKTPVISSVSSSSLIPQKPSVISTRLEQLARSAFTSEKMSYVDKSVGNTRRRGPISDEKSPRDAGKALEVFQQQSLVLIPEEKSLKPVVLREYPLTKKEQSPLTPRREEGGKKEIALRDMFRSDSLVFGRSERDSQVPVFGGSERDFQTMLDTRRELRYSSTKVQLSLSGPDTAPVFRQREDPNRAGTNSPISGRPPVKNAFQSPKVKHSRMAFENRLYQNPTSDWLSEVGSPPDM